MKLMFHAASLDIFHRYTLSKVTAWHVVELTSEKEVTFSNLMLNFIKKSDWFDPVRLNVSGFQAVRPYCFWVQDRAAHHLIFN